MSDVGRRSVEFQEHEVTLLNDLRWNAKRAREVNRIFEERKDIAGHVAGTAGWYAYLAGRMSAILDLFSDMTEKMEERKT